MPRLTISEIAQSPGQWFGWWSHSCAKLAVVHAAAQSGLFNRLDSGPATIEELAGASGISASSAARLVNYLAAEGALELQNDGRFVHTQASRVLQQCAPFTRLSKAVLPTVGQLLDGLESGKSAFEVTHGKSYFAAQTDDPRMGQDFGEFMSLTTGWDEGFIFSQHSFLPFTKAVDVGGSLGSVLMRLLGENEGTSGILFDLQSVTDKAQPIILASPVAERIEVASGSFFESVPAGGDLYLMKQILHDWTDEQCLTILSNTREAIVAQGRLAVIDRLLPEDYISHSNYDVDIQMAILVEGRERRLSEFASLFEATGFKLDRVTENPTGVSVIEAVPV